MINVVDPIPALITWLSTRDPIKELVGEYPSHRIFGSELPEEESNDMPRKAIVIKESGGGGIGDAGPVRLMSNRYDFWCYGENFEEAGLLLYAVHHELHQNLIRVKAGNVLLHHAVRSGGPVSLKDNNDKWPFKLESWLVTASTQVVA